MKAIFQLLNPDNTMSVNRQLAHAIGLCEAVLYSALLSKYAYYEQRGMLDNGWFYSTAEDVEESTALSTKQQRRCIDNLEDEGLIRCEVRGMPARRFFWLNDDVTVLEKILSDCGKSSFTERAKLNSKPIDNVLPQNATTQSVETITDDTPVLPKGKTSFAQTEKHDCPKWENPPYKTKDIKPKLINHSIDVPVTEYHDFAASSCNEVIKAEVAGTIRTWDIADRYGVPFATLAEDIIVCGRSGLVTFRVLGNTVSVEEIRRVYEKINHDTVCRVADYISEKENIRHLRTYLSIALYTAAIEQEQMPLYSSESSIDMEAIMEELRQQYG